MKVTNFCARDPPFPSISGWASTFLCAGFRWGSHEMYIVFRLVCRLMAPYCILGASASHESFPSSPAEQLRWSLAIFCSVGCVCFVFFVSDGLAILLQMIWPSIWLSCKFLTLAIGGFLSGDLHGSWLPCIMFYGKAKEISICFWDSYFAGSGMCSDPAIHRRGNGGIISCGASCSFCVALKHLWVDYLYVSRCGVSVGHDLGCIW